GQPLSAARASTARQLSRRLKTDDQLHLLKRCLYPSLQQFFGISLWIVVTEYRVARYQNFCSGANHVPNRFRGNTPIPFNTIRQAAFSAPFRQSAHLVQRIGDKLLCPKSWIDGHDQDVINDVEDFTQAVDRCCRVDYHSGPAVVLLD